MRVSTSPEVPSRCQCIRKSCLIVIIALGNVLTRNNVEIVSKSSFSIVCRMAPMLALLGGVLITLLTGHIQTSQRRHKERLLQCTFYVMTSNFVKAPEILHAKSRIHVLTARELPCYYVGFAPLIHGC